MPLAKLNNEYPYRCKRAGDHGRCTYQITVESVRCYWWLKLTQAGVLVCSGTLTIVIASGNLVIDKHNTAHSTNRYQLSSTQYNWSPTHNDDSLGVCWSCIGRVQCRKRVQYCLENPATALDTIEFDHLDSMLLL